MTSVELNEKQLARIDEVDNAVHNCIATLLGKAPEDLDWSMQLIAPCTDMLIEFLLKSGVESSIYYPSIVIDEDGHESIEELITKYDYVDQDEDGSLLTTEGEPVVDVG